MTSPQLAAACLALFAVLGAGCASAVRIQVRSDDDTNAGRPLYLLVRSVDSRALVSESYTEAAALVFSMPRESSIQHVQALIPGQDASITLPVPEASDLALYFFFTRPGEKWRVPLPRPIPSDIVVELSSNQVKRVMVRRR